MGIFDDKVDLFTYYDVQIQFRDQIMGATPKDPKVIEGWLRTKTMVTDEEELNRMMHRTLQEMGIEYDPSTPYEDLVKASASASSERNGVGFKRDEQGLYIESRIIKASIKENTNILFAGERWGATKKGPKAFAAERVFVLPDRIYLGKMEADEVQLFVGHVTGPQGPKSTLTYHEVVKQPKIDFTIMVTRDAFPEEDWPLLWVQAQENGLGALRSQGFGRFDILRWDKRPNKNVKRSQAEMQAEQTVMAELAKEEAIAVS